jgi:hypothetical protein
LNAPVFGRTTGREKSVAAAGVADGASDRDKVATLILLSFLIVAGKSGMEQTFLLEEYHLLVNDRHTQLNFADSRRA